MKVETKESDFRRITVVIETEEELEYIWHRLNLSDNGFKKAYMSFENYKEDGELGMEIFKKIDRAVEDQGISYIYD